MAEITLSGGVGSFSGSFSSLLLKVTSNPASDLTAELDDIKISIKGTKNGSQFTFLANEPLAVRAVCPDFPQSKTSAFARLYSPTTLASTVSVLALIPVFDESRYDDYQVEVKGYGSHTINLYTYGNASAAPASAYISGVSVALNMETVTIDTSNFNAMLIEPSVDLITSIDLIGMNGNIVSISSTTEIQAYAQLDTSNYFITGTISESAGAGAVSTCSKYAISLDGIKSVIVGRSASTNATLWFSSIKPL